MSERDLALVEFVGTELTPTDLRHAALVVCGYAYDTEEATMLLDMLGLVSAA